MYRAVPFTSTRSILARATENEAPTLSPVPPGGITGQSLLATYFGDWNRELVSSSDYPFHGCSTPWSGATSLCAKEV